MGDSRRHRHIARAARGALVLALALALWLPPVGRPAQAGPRLPTILSPADAALYARVFTLQDAGEWAEADRLIARIDDPLLMGHVLDQRYLHPTAYRSKFAELAGYLELYADHPEAGRIYRLALRRQPAGAAPPHPPVNYRFDDEAAEQAPAAGNDAVAAIGIPEKPLGPEERARWRRLEKEIKSRVRRGWPTGATEILTSEEFRGLVDDAQYDRLQATIAWSYFAYDKDALAFEMAAASAERSGALMPDADWTAGLAAWRLGDIEAAGRYFEALAGAVRARPALRAAGAYWAARASLVARRPERVSALLAIAAAWPETFYGLLARRALGLAIEFAWEPAAPAPAEIDTLLRVPGVRRAIALVEAGQPLRAERELRKLARNAPGPILRALLAIATSLDVPSVQMAIATRLARTGGEGPLDALYPVPRWVPDAGYTIDPALVFALIRQESKFITRAKSKRGARGVMQLMPRTARSMARLIGLDHFERDQLFDPETNIALGQTYIHHLLAQEQVEGNLFYLVAAYNSGPVKLDKWQRKNRYFDDPLMFMESVPSPETRRFIENVATNFWIYQIRLGEPTPTLDAVAAGEWPRYIPNGTRFEIAHAAP